MQAEARIRDNLVDVSEQGHECQTGSKRHASVHEEGKTSKSEHNHGGRFRRLCLISSLLYFHDARLGEVFLLLQVLDRVEAQLRVGHVDEAAERANRDDVFEAVGNDCHFFGDLACVRDVLDVDGSIISVAVAIGLRLNLSFRGKLAA